MCCQQKTTALAVPGSLAMPGCLNERGPDSVLAVPGCLNERGPDSVEHARNCLQWQMNLLTHIEDVQNQVAGRMDLIEKELDGKCGVLGGLEKEFDVKWGGLEKDLDVKWGGLEKDLDVKWGGQEKQLEAKWGGPRNTVYYPIN